MKIKKHIKIMFSGDLFRKRGRIYMSVQSGEILYYDTDHEPKYSEPGAAQPEEIKNKKQLTLTF